MPCSQSQLVPQGPGIRAPYQGCAISGAQRGATNVTGERYLATTYQYSRAHLWRNFGIVVAYTLLYILITAVASELISFAGTGGGALVFKRSKKAQRQVATATLVADEEEVSKARDGNVSENRNRSGEKDHEVLEKITGTRCIFTWNDVEYTVPYQGGQRQLLNKVSGYIKPGTLIALMGASGAGKTTLLNTLAQRQKTGIVRGEMLVDGRPLGMEFQRATGFCEQMDLHDETATIREALEFSAILRQDRHIPREEKIAYVEKIIDLLELGDLEDAIISSLGVEHRKRVTIGVELAAKPSLLLFLDEPTSGLGEYSCNLGIAGHWTWLIFGLDSQSAYSIVKFLKRLAASGQAIICTIHQPSSILIQEFDMM